MAGPGIPAAAFDFYERLAADNTRTFWQANKAVYDEAVRAPLDALLGELAEYGPFHVFRPHRDVRFSKDKTPYKDHAGAYGESQGGAGFYLQLSAHGILAASGYYDLAVDQLDRYRAAVDAEHTGAEIERIVAELERRKLRIGSMSELKTAPRGYPKDHPRIGLLRRKGLIAAREWPRSGWMSTKAVVGRVRDAWADAAPLHEWLDAHVGPSTIPPDEDELARFGPM